MSSGTPINPVAALDGLLEREDVRWAHIADLNLTSGQLIAHDALSGLERAQPLRLAVEPGVYPVLLGLLHDDDEEVVLAMVDLSGQDVVSWKAATPHQVALTTGVLCLTDEDTCRAFAQRQEALRTMSARLVEEEGVEPSDAERWQTSYRAHMRTLIEGQRLIISANQIAQAIDELLFVELPIDEEQETSLVLFRPALSQGAATAWWGYDEDEEPAMLILDFGFLAPTEDALSLGELLAMSASSAPAQAASLLPGQELVLRLLAQESIELADPDQASDERAQRAQALALGRALEPIMRLPLSDEHRASQLIEALLSHDDVEEVFIEDEELAELLRHHF